MSDISMRNSRGPITLPCGTPDLTHTGSDVVPSTTTTPAAFVPGSLRSNKKKVKLFSSFLEQKIRWKNVFFFIGHEVLFYETNFSESALED
jgi:hypothetical protein